MEGLTFDTGFLIAIDRDERSAWRFWRSALQAELLMTVPAPVVAQAWRGSRNVRMSMFLHSCAIDGLTAANARKIGELLAASSTSDVIDAAVVLGAATRQTGSSPATWKTFRELLAMSPAWGRPSI